MKPETLAPLADILGLLANPTRLAMLSKLQVPRALNELAVPPSREDAGLVPDRAISRQAVERHLDQLVQAGLVAELEGEGPRKVRSYVLNHARLFAAVEELRVLTRLRATVTPGEATLQLDEVPTVDPESRTGPRLVVVRGVPEGRILALEQDRSVLGRGAEADLRIEHDPFISTRHCVFERKGSTGPVKVTDEGTSRNGTLVNGRRIAKDQSVVLKRGNLVAVGRSLLLYLD